MSTELALIAEGGETYQRVLDQLSYRDWMGWRFLRRPSLGWDDSLREAMCLGREYRRASQRFGGLFYILSLTIATGVLPSLQVAFVVVAIALIGAIAFGQSLERILWAPTRKRIDRAARRRSQGTGASRLPTT